MATIQLVYPVQSDGAPEVGKGATKQPNRPSDEQLKKISKNGGFAWFEVIHLHDARYLDWLKKLGALTKQGVIEAQRDVGEGLAVNDEGSSEWILASLPDHYVLYDHVRATESRGEEGKKDERRDIYLYGHPGGPKKRFRSPADFFPHLWWLLTGSTKDSDDCSCKICAPEEFINTAAQLAVAMDGDATQIPEFAKAYADKERKKDAKKAAKRVKAGVVEPTPNVAKQNDAEDVQEPSIQVVRQPPVTTYPTPRIPARHSEQLWDQQLNGYLYRPGELVWFVRESNSLALGAVISRSTDPNGVNHRCCIQPLSFPYRPQRQVELDFERMYPWLAFSTPDPLNPSLRGSHDHFDSINWEQLPQDENTVVDGSIFAAKAVDGTFTLVQSLTPPGTPTMEFEYNGLYLGGELIWMGEAIRFRRSDGGSNNPEIAIVVKIAERLHTGSKPSEVYIVADIYELTIQPLGQATTTAVELPLRVQEDLKYRSNIRSAVRGETVNWNFTSGQVRIPLKDVIGRWYESRRVLPLVKPDVAEHAKRSGDLPDCGPFLNPRGNHLAPGSIGVKKPDRIQAFTRSIPAGTTININFDASLSATTPEAPSQTTSTRGLYQANQLATGPVTGNEWQFIQTDPMDEQGYY